MAYFKPSGGAIENGIVVQAEAPISGNSASISGTYDGTTTFLVKHNGSADFAGDVAIGDSDTFFGTIGDAVALLPNSIVDQFKTVIDGLPEAQPYDETTLPADLPTPLKDALVRATTAGKINLNSDGSATFAGFVDAKNGAGTNLLDLNYRKGRTGSILRAFAGEGLDDANKPVIEFTNDGNATFAGELKVEVPNSWNSSLYIGKEGDSDPGISADGGGTLSCVNLNVRDKGVTSYPIKLSGTDGSASKFAGTIESSQVSASEFKVRSTAPNTNSGYMILGWEQAPRLYGQNIGSHGRKNLVFEVSNEASGTPNYRQVLVLKANLDAHFSGNVTSDGTIGFNLEPDNDANYTVTTETYEEQEELTPYVPAVEEVVGPRGNVLVAGVPAVEATYQTVTKTREIRTYTGPTLDVKEELQFLRARATQQDEVIATLTEAVEALKAAPASDFESRIAALEVDMARFKAI